jgi:ABC-type dipeptide/oligopeptide/nickel transport system ATPase component
MQIQTNERIFICGMTGSGKSVFAKKFLPFYPRVVFHDREFGNSDLIQQYHFTPVHDPETLLMYIQKGKKRILYQPAQGGEKEGIEDFNRVCEIVFKTRNIALMVDEVSSVVKGQNAPYWYGEIQRLGRKYNVGCISLTQRPMKIDQTILSESEHMFIFKLKMPQDRAKIEDVCGEYVDEIENSEGEYPNVYDWKLKIGLRSPKPEDKLTDVEIKEKKKLLDVKILLRTMPYYCFLQWNAHQLILHEPVRI